MNTFIEILLLFMPFVLVALMVILALIEFYFYINKIKM